MRNESQPPAAADQMPISGNGHRAAIASGPPMKPGEYMRLRREAADMDLDVLAALLAESRGQIAIYRSMLLSLEEGDAKAFGMIDALNGVFPFDPTIFLALVGFAADPESELPCPKVCRACACSWNDPCHDHRGTPCGWVGTLDLCSACPIPPELTPAAQPAPAAPNIAASAAPEAARAA